VCGSVVLCAALASPAQYDVGHNITLHGQVQTQDGRPIPVGVTLSLETSEGEPVATRQSDWNGNFEFAGLSATIYTLRTKADKFQDYQQTLDFTDARATYHTLSNVLSAKEKPAVNLSALPSLTDQAAPIKLANIYLKMAEYTKALSEMDTYLRLSPEGPYAASATKVSEKLRSGNVTDAGPRPGTPSTVGP